MTKWFLCFAILLVFIGPEGSLAAPPHPQASVPMYSSGPVTDYSAAQPDSKDVLRFRRGERYNIPNPSVAELGESSDAFLMELPASHFKREAMPFEKIDAVVVGSVRSGQHTYRTTSATFILNSKWNCRR